VNRSISIDKVPDAVRALGWFPTELQIEELLTEIKFSKFHKTQEQATNVDLDDFIKLYLNHRPVDQISMEEVENAFNILAEDGILNPGELMHSLENFGEKMSQVEIAECLDRLCGQTQFHKAVEINSKDFVNKILRL
jgi:Ca2+-binding EF-hand superfamily protein